MSTQSVIPVCLLLAAVCVRAQTDEAPEAGDEAPADIEDPPQEGPAPATPAPPTPPGDENKNLYCYGTQDKANEICRSSGDTNANCTVADGSCTCSPGFEGYTDDKGIVFPGCFSSPEDLEKVEERSQSGNFAGGDFNSFTKDLQRAFEKTWEDTVKKNITSSFYSKGSINYVFTFQASLKEMGDIVAAKGQLVENVKNDPTLNTVMKPETLTVTTGSASPEECERANAAKALVVEGVCQATECNPGYQLYVSIDGVQICTSQSRDLDEDDSLTDGEIAGIVVAAVLFAAVIIGGVVYVFMSNKSTNTTPDEFEEPTKKRKESVAAVDHVDEASAPRQSLYNTPYGDMETDPQMQSHITIAEDQIR